MRSSFISIFVLGFVLGCQDLEYPQSFPVVLTDDVVSVSPAGAEFIGRVESLGTNQHPLSYGFVWGEVSRPTLNSAHIAISGGIRKGEFIKTVHYDLVAGNGYYVRAFIQTDSLVIYGNQVSFTSQGSLPPEIVDFTPKKGVDGTEVAIKGKNFSTRTGGNVVKIGTASCAIISITDSLLIVKSPITTLVGDYKISVIVAGQTAVSGTDYSILGPRMTSISKASGRVGDLVTIQGEYFDIATSMAVFFGSGYTYSSDPYVLSSKQLECYVADNPGAMVKLKLRSYYNTTVKEFTFPDDFTILNSWSKVSDQTPLGNVTGYLAVTINGLGYVVGGNKLYSFNPATKAWVQKTSFTGTARTRGVAFVLNNKLYYGFGEASIDGLRYNDLWRYDPTTNAWEFVINAPILKRSRLVAFVIDSKAYIGFGFSKVQLNPVYYSDFWRFDPIDNSWTTVTTPVVNGLLGASSFSAGGKGYVVGLKQTEPADVWEFNPLTAAWVRKQDFPDLIQGNPALSLASSGLVFSGSRYGGKNRLYEYEPIKDRWIIRQTFPASGRIEETAFFVNDKIYYGLGSYTNANSLTPDFWEFTLK